METEALRTEQLNKKAFYVRLFKKLPRIALGAVIGAVVFAALYFVYHNLSNGVLYRARGVLYLHFAYDESGEVYDYYNAYTWNDLIHTDTMRDLIAETEPDAGEEDLLRIMGDTVATVPSDGRVLTITSSDPESEEAEKAVSAYLKALTAFGEKMEEFTSIEPMEEGKAERVVYDNRILVAAIAGAVLGALCMLFYLLISLTASDAIYAPEDAARRYGVPLLGVRAKEGEQTLTVFEKELAANLARLPAYETIRIGEALMETPGGSNPVVLEIPFGVDNGARALHVTEQLRASGRELLGVIVTDADMKFLEAYYGTAKNSG